MQNYTNWWFQPIWKTLVKLDHFAQVGVKKNIWVATTQNIQYLAVSSLLTPVLDFLSSLRRDIALPSCFWRFLGTAQMSLFLQSLVPGVLASWRVEGFLRGFGLQGSWWSVLFKYTIWVFPKIGVPPNHPFLIEVFHYFHHPFWGAPIFGNIQIVPSNIFQTKHVGQLRSSIGL